MKGYGKERHQPHQDRSGKIAQYLIKPVRRIQLEDYDNKGNRRKVVR